jgi:hypothetical protein
VATGAEAMPWHGGVRPWGIGRRILRVPETTPDTGRWGRSWRCRTASRSDRQRATETGRVDRQATAIFCRSCEY